MRLGNYSKTSHQKNIRFSLVLGSKVVSIPSKEWFLSMIMIKCSSKEVLCYNQKRLRFSTINWVKLQYIDNQMRLQYGNNWMRLQYSNVWMRPPLDSMLLSKEAFISKNKSKVVLILYNRNAASIVFYYIE